jgi:hypothetical protein
MTAANPDHAARLAAGILDDRTTLPPFVEHVDAVPADAALARLCRVKASHRGIARRSALRSLWAHAVDADFLGEIAQLRELRDLHLSRVTAPDLAPLAQLQRLERLTVMDATRVTDLDWLPATAPLTVLGLENLKRVDDLAPLARFTGLRALAVEGSLWTTMRVRSLEPLARLTQLQHLFLTNLRAADQSLRPLHGLRGLRELQSARFFPRAEFEALQRANPSLHCRWFDPARWPDRR